MNTAPQPSDYPTNEAIVVEESTEIIEPSTPEMWPVYLSLGALGLAILVFIILNLFGGKRKE